jgi:signal transduction histidine kinase
MTPEQMSKFLQEFSQACSATASKYSGTGLSKRFCQMMGGDITAENEPGRGSAFTNRPIGTLLLRCTWSADGTLLT